MFSRTASWSRRKRLNAGVWCSPLLFLAANLASYFIPLRAESLSSLFPRFLPSEDWLTFIDIALSCIFWMACAAFAGLCAAFFWHDTKMDRFERKRLTLRSAAITWGITFPFCCVWVVLGWPYLLVFRLAVDRGLKFWNSNRPREWIGDFSDPDAPDES